jgi:rubrerythrin
MPPLLFWQLVCVGLLLLAAKLYRDKQRFRRLLRILLEPPHRHKCPDCGHVWEHTTFEALQLHRCGENPHHCPLCGTKQELKYYGE